MGSRIAINGFGRVGRSVLRVLLETEGEFEFSAEELGLEEFDADEFEVDEGGDLADGDFAESEFVDGEFEAEAIFAEIEVVAINDLAAGEVLAHLYNFDSIYGRALEPARIEQGATGDVLVVGEHRIRLFSERDPAELPWRELEIDTVLEATGRFTQATDAQKHLDAGAQRVLVSAPSAGADATLVRGINWGEYDPELDRIVSTASCTTNALAPLAHVLHELAGIEQGIVSTVHAYTADQHLVDGPHRDLRRARAAALNIVPTSTGAAKAIGLVLPELDGRLAGDALRVPIPTGSIVELTALVEREVTIDEVHAAYREAADGELAGVLEYSEDPLVSSDIVGDPASAVYDAGLTRVLGRQIKVSAWYDNEWGFSHRAAETLVMMGLR